MDMAGAAITMVCVLSERRLNRLTNPALSQGLPDFLAHEPGFYSGLMLSQYTADHLIVEQRMLSAPASHPVHPGRGRPGGLRLDGHEHGPQERPDPRQRLRRARASSSWPPPRRSTSGRSRSGKGSQAAREVIRQHVAHLDVDRPLFHDHNAMKALVKSGEILEAVERAVGTLG